MTTIQTRLHRAGFRRAHLPLILYFSCFIALGASSSLLGVAWPYMQQTFNQPLDAVAFVLTASTIGFLLISVIAGQLSAKLGLVRFLLLSNVVMAVAFLGHALTPSWWLLIALSLLGGWGTGGFDTGLNIFVAENHGVRVMNWTHAMFGVGATIGPLIMTAAITTSYGWRAGYFVLAVAIFSLSFLFLPMIRRANREPMAAQTQIETVPAAVPAVVAPAAAKVARPLETLRIPLVWLGILFFGLYAGTEVTAGQWAFALFTESRGIAPELAGIFVSLFWGGLTVGRLFMGALAPRMGTIMLVRSSIIGGCVAAVLLWFTHPITGLISIILFGFSLAAIFPTMMSDTPRRIGSQHAPNAIGYQMSAASIGVAALPGLAGVLADSITLEIIAPFLLINSLILLLLNETILRLSRRKPTL